MCLSHQYVEGDVVEEFRILCVAISHIWTFATLTHTRASLPGQVVLSGDSSGGGRSAALQQLPAVPKQS